MAVRERTVAGSAWATAATQVTTMALGALLAVVVLAEFGASARTDGLFAAYGVYTMAVVLAQSFRVSVVPRLVEDEAALGRFLVAALLLFALGALPFVVLGGPLASLLTGELGPSAREAARDSLALLWPAVGAQLVAGLGAAALAVRGSFALPGAAYVAGAALSLGLLLGLAGPLGIDAVALAVAAGSVVTAAVVMLALGRPRLARPREGVRAAGVMFAGSASFLVFQLAYVVSLAFAARLGEGAPTLYAYAFFAAALVLAVTSGTGGVVLAAPLAATWEGRSESLRPHVLVLVRTGAAVAVPLFALGALVGDELLETVVSAAEANLLVGAFLSLAGVVAAGIVGTVPSIAAFAASRYRLVALASGAGLAVHFAGSAAAVETGRLELLAGAASLGSAVSVLVLLAGLYGRRLPDELALAGRELGRALLVGALAFGPAAALAASTGALGDVLASIGGLALYVALLRALLPAHWELVGRLWPRSV